VRGVFGPGTAAAVLCQAGEMIVTTYHHGHVRQGQAHEDA
jgi:hypothetical protein